MNRNVQILLGLGIVAAVGAYFLLKPKDAQASEMPPYQPLTPPPTGTPLPVTAGSGTPIQITPQVLPDLAAQKTLSTLKLNIPGMTSVTGSTAGGSSLVSAIRSGAFKF